MRKPFTLGGPCYKRARKASRMTYPQSTLQELAESERQMVLEAEARFGKYWVEARASSIFLSRCIIAIDHDRMHVGRFNAILKKHHLLAIMSAVRLHKSQAMWNSATSSRSWRARRLRYRQSRRRTFLQVGKRPARPSAETSRQALRLASAKPQTVFRRDQSQKRHAQRVADSRERRRGAWRLPH